MFLILGLIWGYNLVFSSSFVFNPEIKYIGTLSENIYLDDENLSKTIIAYESNINISHYSVYSSCDIDYSFLEKYKSYYFFEVDFTTDSDCGNNNIALSHDGETVLTTLSQVDFLTAIDKIEVLVDYPDSELSLISGGLQIDMRKNAIYKNYDGTEISKYYNYLAGQRKYREAEYKKSIIDGVRNGRKKQYSSPVPGKTISHHHSKIPNAGRAYRESYTDGVHRGWDIAAEFGAGVAALDDGIIVRVVRDFDRSDFARIVYGDNLSVDQELKNLDILRGKQVWLKTLKGEVVFYSHLDSVPLNIKEWMLVSRGEWLGTIGVTWVPGANYTDYHLHFAIMENPYKIEKAGSYDFGDYMAWDWKLKDLPLHEVIEKQKDIFE